MAFKQGETVTRKEIAGRLGGIGVGTLPAKDGRIVCGLFDLSTNAVSHLSGEIDVYPKTIPKAAGKLDYEIPVFLKISTQLYRHVGDFKLDDLDKSKKATDQAKKELGRDDIAAVLRFKPVRPPLIVTGGRRRKG